MENALFQIKYSIINYQKQRMAYSNNRIDFKAQKDTQSSYQFMKLGANLKTALVI